MGMAGINHLAFITNDMKAQIEFYTQIVGYELVGIFPFHGVDGATHCFLDSGNGFLLSFVQQGENVEKVAPVYGVSHARDVGGPAAGGAMQHIAMEVDSMDELMALRDRLRTAGYAVFGPLSHGSTYSMYLGSPEGIQLEFVTTEGCTPLDPEKWIEPASAAALGMNAEDLKRYRHPPKLEMTGGKVPQPPKETAVPPAPIPAPMFEKLGYLNDEELNAAMNFADAQA